MRGNARRQNISNKLASKPKMANLRHISNLCWLSSRRTGLRPLFSIQRFMSSRLRELGISLSSYPVLIYLYYASGSQGLEFTQTHLCKESGQDPGLISRSLKKLSEQGYVRIRANTEKLSSNLVSITNSGMKIAKEIEARIDQWEAECWDDLLTEKEKDCCLSVLQKVSLSILEEDD